MKVKLFASQSMTDVLDAVAPVASALVESKEYDLKDGSKLTLEGSKVVYKSKSGQKLESPKLSRVDQNQVSMSLLLIIAASGLNSEQFTKNFNADAPLQSLALLKIAYLTAVATSANFQWIHWNAQGTKFDRIHSMAEEYYKMMVEEVDFLAELNLQHGQTVMNPLSVGEDAALIVAGYEYEGSIEALKFIVEKYLTALKALSESLADFRGDQSKLDDMIAYWDKELNYKLARRL